MDYSTCDSNRYQSDYHLLRIQMYAHFQAYELWIDWYICIHVIMQVQLKASQNHNCYYESDSGDIHNVLPSLHYSKSGVISVNFNGTRATTMATEQDSLRPSWGASFSCVDLPRSIRPCSVCVASMIRQRRRKTGQATHTTLHNMPGHQFKLINENEIEYVK